MLSIPREHFQHIADIMVSADTATTREPSERVLTAIFQIDQLQKAVNKALNISELDQIALKGGKHPPCASQQQQQETSVDDHQQAEVTTISSSSGAANPPLTIQVGVVRDIASSLSSELTTLLVRIFWETLYISDANIHILTLHNISVLQDFLTMNFITIQMILLWVLSKLLWAT